METSFFQERFDRLETLLTSHGKDVLTFQEAVQFLDVSASHLYKLTSLGVVPHSKPQGKKLYFSKRELEVWLLSKPVKTRQEIEAQAASHVVLRGKRKGGVQ
jgi:excisionase family DNA binding protein